MYVCVLKAVNIKIKVLRHAILRNSLPPSLVQKLYLDEGTSKFLQDVTVYPPDNKAWYANLRARMIKKQLLHIKGDILEEKTLLLHAQA